MRVSGWTSDLWRKENLLKLTMKKWPLKLAKGREENSWTKRLLRVNVVLMCLNSSFRKITHTIKITKSSSRGKQNLTDSNLLKVRKDIGREEKEVIGQICPKSGVLLTNEIDKSSKDTSNILKILNINYNAKSNMYCNKIKRSKSCF